MLLIGGTAVGQDLQAELDETESELGNAKQRKEVLSSELAAFRDQVAQLSGEVAVLRNRELLVEEELQAIESRLQVEVTRLVRLRDHLGRSLNSLRQRLVAIYRTGSPDLATIVLASDGLDDLVTRYEYLDRIQDRDAAIVGRVRSLRDRSEATVERVRQQRDTIAAKEAELERTRVQLEARQAELDAVRDQKAATLERVDDSIERLEGDVSDLTDEITQRLQAQTSSSVAPLPAGPIQGAAGGFIWPIDAVLTSPFGPRWGRLHAGLDLAAPGGTPIRATRAGSVTMAEYYGGYGNYTCVDHGGGVSSCYAHQSGFNTSAGASVESGDVIGYVGTTGSSTGDHLHFEIRVNGTPVDPMGYLS